MQRHRGSILIIALAVMALTAGIATMLLRMQSIEIKKTELMLIQDKLSSHVREVEAHAFGLLQQAAEEQPKNEKYDDLTQDWAKPFEPREIDGVMVSGRIVDLQGFFNVNTLLLDEEEKETLSVEDRQQEEKAKQENKFPEDFLPKAIFSRLLEAIPGMEQGGSLPPEVIAKYVTDWISSKPAASDEEYESGSTGFSYRPGKVPLLSISELRLIKGITPVLMLQLINSVIALPTMPKNEESGKKMDFTKININTGSPLVISAILNIPVDRVMEIIDARPYKNISMISENIIHLDEKELTSEVISSWLDIKSEYFMIESKASFRSYNTTWYTVVTRTGENQIEVLYRMKGIY